MTAKLERLDVFVIEDNINCTQDELNKRAQHIADDISAKNGWRSIEVRSASPKPEERNGFLRYVFEIFGIPNQFLGTTHSEAEKNLDSPEKIAARPDIGL